MLSMGCSATVTRKEIKAPNVNRPLKDIENEVCKTLIKAKPARVAINAEGIFNINSVKNGEKSPKIIARTHITIADEYCLLFSPLLDNIALTGPVKQVETDPNIAVIKDIKPHAVVIELIGGLCSLDLKTAIPWAFWAANTVIVRGTTSSKIADIDHSGTKIFGITIDGLSSCNFSNPEIR